MVAVKFLLVLFAVITITTTAVPLKSESEKNVFPNSVKKFLRTLQLSQRNNIALGKYQGFTQSTKEYKDDEAAEMFNERSFRLPNNTEPLSYNIRLSTDIHRGDFGFQGQVTINIRALEVTNSIALHSRQTIIERIDVFNSNGTVEQEDVHYTYDSEVEFLVITLNRDLEVGEELAIEISYMGFLRTDLMGFFRSSYYNPDTGQITWLATTQFQPINARHAFPCYDEIRYRRPIDLQIRHHRNYNAISNMPVAELTIDGEYATTVFEQTLPIPVFVLAFTISDFDFVQNIVPGLEFRVYGRPSAIAAGEGDEGLRLAELMLRLMESIFNMTYSLPKSDQVAIPTFASDGALNWGLITHREDVILSFNNDIEAQEFRQLRIGHEYAHIFFANLVAPSSWAYLWLNEGLATLYEQILNNQVSPEGLWWQRFLINNYDTAITIDVDGLMSALNDYAETPQEIRAKFDFITYNKGAVVLRMIGDGIGVGAFQWGLSYYISELQLGSASPEDLYAKWQRAYDEANPGNELNVASVVSTWFDNAGFPIVTVSRSSQGLIVQQEGFRTLHNELFGIPINYATASNPNFINVRAQFWLTTSEVEISSDSLNMTWNADNDWIIFNLRDTSYYITNYDDELWDRIIRALNDDHEIIDPFNRGTFFADFHRFILNDFDIRATIFLRIMESLPIEFDAHVWNRAALGLGLTEVRLRATEFHTEHLNFVREIMSQVYEQRAFNDRMATNVINEWSCLSGVQECLDDALNILIEVMETGRTDFEFDYQCNGLRAANETIWMEFFYDVVDTTSTEDRSTALTDLLCTENENLVRFYLQQVVNDTNSLLPSERELILTTAAVQHETPYFALIEFIERYNEVLNSITSISNLVFELAVVTNTDYQAEWVFSLFPYVPDFDEAFELFIMETIRPNVNFTYRNYEHFRVWYDERNNLKAKA